KGMLCIDLTPAVLDEAIDRKCQLVVAYHPPIFRALARLADRDWKERMLAKAVRTGIAVYSPHTSLDAVRGGMNDWLCDGLGAQSVRWSIGVPREQRLHRYKVIVYATAESADDVRAAMSDAGAGGIGNDDRSAFSVEGLGSFGPASGAEHAQEVRIEVACWRDALGTVIKGAREAHRDPEPTIEVVELSAQPESEEEEQSPGRCMHLRTPISAATLIRRVKRHLGVKKLKAAVPPEYGDEHPGQLGSLAVCVGAGGSLFEKYRTADAYITGEMQHHQVLDMVQRGKVVLLAGHTNTERPFLHNYRDAIALRCGAVEWMLSERDVSPLSLV
ncbi:MAG: Nif3-like dinuclear metal center hexameric protein, partial [Nannocystaceae bacterium]|nr:Nif3-like dinuclear metal center hexameric protein [Nannocystaceae bacterium]